jgi:3',5'-nucleoside bisphosphate phosphatase
LSPAELVSAAREARLAVLSITDHDSLDAYCSLPEGPLGVELVVGVEISAFHDGGEIHILGYFVDPDDAELSSLLDRMVRARRERALRIVDKLSAAGVRFSRTEVDRLMSNKLVGRPHIARAMVENGTVSTRKEAFSRYLTPGTPGYERRPDLPSAKETVSIIARAGGVSVWAHPGTNCMIDPTPLVELQQFGLAGLEVHHPRHSSGEGVALATFARQRGLVATGGSDFHGDGREGVLVGDYAVGTEVVELLARRRGRLTGS